MNVVEGSIADGPLPSVRFSNVDRLDGVERRLSAFGLNAAKADVEGGMKGVPVGDVITKGGEIVGGWNMQESDALYDFLPGMETKPVATGAFLFDLK